MSRDSAGQIRTHNPAYDAKRKVFSQTMEFHSNIGKLDGDAILQVMEHAERLFRGSLLMNDLTVYAWPPEKVEAMPNEDFTAATFRFATHASKPGVIVVH